MQKCLLETTALTGLAGMQLTTPITHMHRQLMTKAAQQKLTPIQPPTTHTQPHLYRMKSRMMLDSAITPRVPPVSLQGKQKAGRTNESADELGPPNPETLPTPAVDKRGKKEAQIGATRRNMLLQHTNALDQYLPHE